MLSLIVMAVLLAILGSSLLLWIAVFVKMSNRQPVVPYEPRQMVPWGGVDVLAAVGMAMGAMLAIGVFGRRLFGIADGATMADFSADQLRNLLLSDSATKLAIMAVLVVVLMVKNQATWRDFGWVRRRLGVDCLYGVAGFLMLLVPTLAIQVVLVQFWPSKHPLEALLEKPMPDVQWWATFGVVTIVAVIVAPLVEEFFFRVLLQGWLEKVAVRWAGGQVSQPATNEEVTMPPGFAKEEEDAVGDEYPTAAFSGSDNPYAASQVDDAVDFATDPQSPVDEGEPLRRHWLVSFVPILVSSTIFAGLHAGSGPDPIPLMVLAMGLGYLYQRTHRVVPCMVVHFLFNSFSVVGLLIKFTLDVGGT